MNITLNAQLLSTAAGYRRAGIHSYIDNLLRNLPRASPASWRWTALVGAQHRGDYAGIRLARSRLATDLPLRRILWEQALQPWCLRGVDLYHALAFVAPALLPAPMVVTVYDLSFLRYPQRLSRARRLYLRRMTALTCARARRILAISQSTADELVRLLGVPAAKIDVSQLGYDEARFRPLPPARVAQFRQQRGLPGRFWLTVGTIEPRKNLSLLLRAYAALPRKERLPWLLVGGLGWRGQELLAAIEGRGLQGSVRHIGFIPDEELPLWYNSAEALLFPSLYEGFGLPVLEAMACGCPVLCSDVSSLPEVAGSAGICLPPDDAPRWTQALHNAYADSAWRAGARGRGLQQAAQFSWQRTAAATVRSYRKALDMGSHEEQSPLPGMDTQRSSPS